MPGSRINKSEYNLHLVLIIAVLFFVFLSNFACADEEVYADGDPTHRFELFYNKLLQTYWRPTVPINGINTTVLDYAAMASDANRSDSLFMKTMSALALVDPTALPVSNQTKAFWINAYNFGAMRMIVEHYPVDTITSFKISLFKHPWSKASLRVGDHLYSLSEIEKEKLLKEYDDPRIVFAVSCAAVSCPDRTAKAFNGQDLDEQLDNQIREFFSNSGKGLLIDRGQGRLTLSWILQKDAHLFGDDIKAFVMPYLPLESQGWLKNHDVEIHYFDHDWTLNDLAQVDKQH